MDSMPTHMAIFVATIFVASQTVTELYRDTNANLSNKNNIKAISSYSLKFDLSRRSVFLDNLFIHYNNLIR